jgi:hypothetical protein
LQVIDVWDAVKDRLDVVDLGVDEVLHEHVGADRAAERLLVVVEHLLVVVEHLELYRRWEKTSQVDHVGIANDRRLMQLQVEALLKSIIDEHLDG